MTTYRATFKPIAGEKKVVPPGDYAVMGYGARVLSSRYVEGLLVVDFTILTGNDTNTTSKIVSANKTQGFVVALPIAGIAVGILVIAGLAIVYYNLVEVHEIIESPQGSFLAIAVVLIIGVLAWRFLK